jgi:membrane protein implicated in regulation of membrane protease activity
LTRLDRLAIWVLFAIGLAAFAVGTYLLFTGRSTFWSVLAGVPVCILAAWLVVKLRRGDEETTERVMGKGILAIFFAPFTGKESGVGAQGWRGR